MVTAAVWKCWKAFQSPQHSDWSHLSWQTNWKRSSLWQSIFFSFFYFTSPSCIIFNRKHLNNERTNEHELHGNDTTAKWINYTVWFTPFHYIHFRYNLKHAIHIHPHSCSRRATHFATFILCIHKLNATFITIFVCREHGWHSTTIRCSCFSVGRRIQSKFHQSSCFARRQHVTNPRNNDNNTTNTAAKMRNVITLMAHLFCILIITCEFSFNCQMVNRMSCRHSSKDMFSFAPSFARAPNENHFHQRDICVPWNT